MEGKSVGVLKAHVALYVSDVGRSIQFYRKLLGLEPCKVRRGYAKFDVAEPPLNLTLNERAREARCASAGARRGSRPSTRCRRAVATPCKIRLGWRTRTATSGRPSSSSKTTC